MKIDLNRGSDIVKIHNKDMYNLCDDLAKIIHPCLLKFKEKSTGSFNVEDSDVPARIKSTSAPKPKEFDLDDFHEKRYDYVLDEMIWSFKEIVDGYPGEEKFHSGNIDISFIPIKNSKYSEISIGEKDTYKFDNSGFQVYNERIENGLRLFGKYFRGLWT